MLCQRCVQGHLLGVEGMWRVNRNAGLMVVGEVGADGVEHGDAQEQYHFIGPHQSPAVTWLYLSETHLFFWLRMTLFCLPQGQSPTLPSVELGWPQ